MGVILMASLADVYRSQSANNRQMVKRQPEKPKRMDIVFHMPEVKSLIRHLDVLYSSMIIQNMSRPSNDSMWETISWFSPGQGAVKQSQSVN